MESVLIAGGSGLIGQRLAHLLNIENYQPIILTRKKSLECRYEQLVWDVKTQQIDSGIGHVDHIINLAGAGIGDRRWTPSRKKEITSSRILATRFLAQSVQKYQPPLKNFISGSAIGYYGNSGPEWVDENSVNGSDFLASVCQSWESEALALKSIVPSLTIVRIGVVLSSSGGALEKMARPVSLGIASYPGKGNQYLPWIHIDDLCQLLIHLLRTDANLGIYNGVAPEPIQQKEFMAILKEKINPYALHISTPEFAMKMLLGEMSALILNSNKVSAQKIVDTGFEFMYPHAEDALSQIYT